MIVMTAPVVVTTTKSLTFSCLACSCSGRANISYHAHFGPVTFFLNLQPKVITAVVEDVNDLASQGPQGQEENCIREEPETSQEDEAEERDKKSLPLTHDGEKASGSNSQSSGSEKVRMRRIVTTTVRVKLS